MDNETATVVPTPPKTNPAVRENKRRAVVAALPGDGWSLKFPSGNIAPVVGFTVTAGGFFTPVVAGGKAGMFAVDLRQEAAQLIPPKD